MAETSVKMQQPGGGEEVEVRPLGGGRVLKWAGAGWLASKGAGHRCWPAADRAQGAALLLRLNAGIGDLMQRRAAAVGAVAACLCVVAEGFAGGWVRL